MTWSIAHQANFDLSGANGYSAAHDYHFLTFLPSRGWTVTKGQPTNGSLPTTNNAIYQCSKTFTLPDATTTTKHWVYHLRFDFGIVETYSWDNVDFGTSAVTLRSESNVMSVLGGQGNNTEFTWLASDEHQDAWIMLSADNTYVGGASIPVDGWLHNGYDNLYPGLIANSNGYFCIKDASSGYFGFIGNTVVNSYLMTNTFFYATANTAGNYSYNTLNDFYLRMNGTQISTTAMSATGPASVLIDGRYYLDLRPNSNTSLMLDTDQTDLGVL
ncbi:MAG: hypothetical protein CL959_01870 [Euryarchaeota archaeon]|nr:hypothetical protein [Euryarchaeota archaeon]|tara:strand:+ start:5025 stop:5840 length:816 start_codon:yes stop_codon:yes gene_type:complete